MINLEQLVYQSRKEWQKELQISQDVLKGILSSTSPAFLSSFSVKPQIDLSLLEKNKKKKQFCLLFSFSCFFPLISHQKAIRNCRLDVWCWIRNLTEVFLQVWFQKSLEKHQQEKLRLPFKWSIKCSCLKAMNESWWKFTFQMKIQKKTKKTNGMYLHTRVVFNNRSPKKSVVYFPKKRIIDHHQRAGQKIKSHPFRAFSSEWQHSHSENQLSLSLSLSLSF